MSTEWGGDEAKKKLREAAARGLIRAGVMFKTKLAELVSIPNPPPYLKSSKPGEYPRLRTGEGRAALMLGEDKFEDIVRKLAVKVGYNANAPHLLWLELYKKRKGLVQTLEDYRRELAEVAVAEFRK